MEKKLTFEADLEDSRYCRGCYFLKFIVRGQAYCGYFDTKGRALESNYGEFIRCKTCIDKFGE